MRRVVIACCALLLTLTATPAGAASVAAAGVLEGQVADAQGQPLAGARVTAVRADAPADVVATADTSDDGSWALDLEDGTYHVHIADPSGPHVDEWWDDRGEPLDTVEITDGEGPTAPLETTLAEGAVLEGTVTGPDGPLTDAVARVERTAFWERESAADEHGRFTLRGLPAGRQTVGVSAAGHAAVTRDVELAAGEPLEERYRLLPVPDGVERVSGRERVATAVEASRRGFGTARTVVIADAGSFPDALAAAALAAHVDGPLLLVGPRLTPIVVDELRRLQAQEAVVVGAVGAVPLVVQEELRREGLEVRRVAGDSRFDTAALIAREVGAPDGVAIVANGGTFADALSVAPYAAAKGIPVLLTGPDRLNVDAAAALAELSVQRTIVVGGTGAVSDAVLADLPSPQRLAGRTRYDTSLEIARHWAAEDASLEVVSFATGRDYPDALAAGPVAALAHGPLLLVDGMEPAIPEATYSYLAAHRDEIAGAYAFGGSAVMAPAVLDRLTRALQGGGA